jgi:hypothetical protein
MDVYMFASRTYSSIRAFTSDKTGGNLPDSYAPWYPTDDGQATSFDDETHPVAMAVRRDGYFLVSGKAQKNPRRTAI